jgi:hypothetical protein
MSLVGLHACNNNIILWPPFLGKRPGSCVVELQLGCMARRRARLGYGGIDNWIILYPDLIVKW